MLPVNRSTTWGLPNLLTNIGNAANTTYGTAVDPAITWTTSSEQLLTPYGWNTFVCPSSNAFNGMPLLKIGNQLSFTVGYNFYPSATAINATSKDESPVLLFTILDSAAHLTLSFTLGALI